MLLTSLQLRVEPIVEDPDAIPSKTQRVAHPGATGNLIKTYSGGAQRGKSNPHAVSQDCCVLEDFNTLLYCRLNILIFSIKTFSCRDDKIVIACFSRYPV